MQSPLLNHVLKKRIVDPFGGGRQPFCGKKNKNFLNLANEIPKLQFD